MTFPRRGSLLVEYSTHNCTLSDRDKDAYEVDLGLLARVVERFPASMLHVEVEHLQRTGAWQVKTDLSLARTIDLFAREQAEQPLPAFKQCVRVLTEKVAAFKQGHGERVRPWSAEAPATTVRATSPPDLQRLRQAVEAADFVAFRDAIAIYREPLQSRIGRRIELQPEAAVMLGRSFSLDDCVEEVFLNAFADFRPPAVAEGLGEWLESLIDASIRALAADPDDERSIIDFLRTARQAAHEQVERDGRAAAGGEAAG